MTDDGDNVIQGDFSALGHAGSESYVGLELIPLDEEAQKITFNSNEFTAVCPVTGQPDLYDLEIVLRDTSFSIESKSLKIYLTQFRNQGAFAEVLARQIKEHIAMKIDAATEETALIWHPDQVTVTITQKRRGGIEIEVVA